MTDKNLATFTSLNTSLVALMIQNTTTSLRLASSAGVISTETNKYSHATMPNKDWTTRKVDLLKILNDVELLLAEL
jgi:hypothetical protein